MFWEQRISTGCLMMYAFWAAGLGMLIWGWTSGDVHMENTALGLVIAAATVSVLRDGMRTRKQISAIAKRRDQQERDREQGGGGGNVRPFVRPDSWY